MADTRCEIAELILQHEFERLAKEWERISPKMAEMIRQNLKEIKVGLKPGVEPLKEAREDY